MVQSGIAYAAGQLLAVVAPRTVLVVDAPTDWSLAGPLWELALDDAPVDEILDVLIRRGIRTAPSFAIVRVESDAVRALVRGSVPVCFERVGEPVRLDATGATTWLEGLISGARRVLVGAVETNTSLPFLVSTGVVLVSGLALPCAPAEQSSRPDSGPQVVEPAPPPEPDPAPSGDVFSPPVPVPSGSGPLVPAAGREPRVVDLTRSESRPPLRSFSPVEPRESWALAAKNGGPDRSEGLPLNGHVPAVLEPAPAADPIREPEPEPRSSFGSPWSFEARPSAFEAAPSPFAPPSSPRAPSAFQPPDRQSSPDRQPTPADDDPGELHDLDGEHDVDADLDGEPDLDGQTDLDGPTDLDTPRESASPLDAYFPAVDAPAKPRTGTRSDYSAFAPPAEDLAVTPAAPRTEEPDPLDDLLVEPAEDDLPPSPSPADLPNLDPPGVALPLPAALHGLPPRPRSFGGVPAAWPPAQESTDEHPQDADQLDADQLDNRGQQDDLDQPDEADEVDRHDVDAAVEVQDDTDHDHTDQDDTDQDESAAEAQSGQPPLGDLPLRVRGRSLRPEQSAPVNGRLLGGTPDTPPPSPVPPLRSLSEARAQQQPDSGSQDQVADSRSDAGPNSGALLLPAFFRGARAARNSGPNDLPPPPVAREAVEEPPAAPGPVPWGLNGANSAPAAWSPPARRFPERNDRNERNGFNGGPPAMPGVLRPAGPDDAVPVDDTVDDEQIELPTEHTDPPTSTPSGGIELDQEREPLREPPRLLGVWCDAGHVTSPDRDECRVCGLAVPRQAPILVARPPLGVLIFDNGDRVEVDRPVVLGRDPKPVASADPETPILHPVASATGQVSRTHAEIRASGWDVVLTDLDAMNGTAVTLPGQSPLAIEPGVPTLITPGARVDLGGETGFVFEVEG